MECIYPDKKTAQVSYVKQKLFIGMPVFNGGQYIEEALNSLCHQTFTNWKMLISDNASTDSTPAICKLFTQLDHRISYVQQPENIGLIANFDFLLMNADCDYFMWAACDDAWDPDFLLSCINRLEADENPQMAFTGIINIDSYGRKIREYPDLHLLSGMPSYKIVSNFICSPEVMGKANLIHSVYRADFCKSIWSICPFSGGWGGDMSFMLGAIARGGISIDPRELFKKRYARSSDAPDKVDYIHIADPFQHIFPHDEFASYFGEHLKAVEGTPFYGLTYTIMLMRRAGLDRMIPEVIQFIPETFSSLDLMTTAVSDATAVDFTHEKAQTYEAASSRSWLSENFDRLYDKIIESRDDYFANGEVRTEERGLYEFFQGDENVWRRFINQVKGKACLEIGSGPCGASCGWHFIRNWHVIDPLVADYKQMTLEMFGKTWWWDRLNLHPQNAELLLPDLIGKIDGVIVCRNCLDHTDDPIQVINNLARYAAPGCKLLLWTDLYHLQGRDEGHRNICKTKDEFRTLITNKGFSIDYETPPFRQGETIEFGCVATKISKALVCQVIVFSKDRPLQLDATLRSFTLHCLDSHRVSVQIIVMASNESFGKAYQILEQEYASYSNILFISENDFRKQVVDFLKSEEYLLWLVDDNIFVRDFDLASCCHLLDLHQDALGYSLRLGENTTYCYSLDKSQELPIFDQLTTDMLKYDWTSAKYDFGYPLEVSSSLYRTKDMLQLLTTLQFHNPNSLEAEMAGQASQFQKSHPYLLCSKHSLTFCNPINKVQNTAGDNRAGESAELTAESLLACYLNGQRIDVAAFNGFTPNACHQEVTFNFTQTEDSSPKVSVVIPCYNQAHFLTEAVESVIAQTFTDWECLIVNDGSSDNTSEVAGELIERFHEYNISLIVKENGGLSEARNTGIRAARGNYILPFDSDDKIHKDMLAHTVALLDADPTVSIAYTDQVYFGAENKIIHCLEYDVASLLKANYFGYCSLYRKSVWETVGGYKNNMKWGYEDWEFWISCSEAGFIARRIPKCLLYYRVKENSMVTTAREHDAELKAQIVLNHPTLYSKASIESARQLLNNNSIESAPFKGLTLSNDSAFRIIAIIAAYNEGDVIYHVIQNLVEQGIDVYLIDPHSTDNTVEEATKWLGKGLMHIETFPDDANYAEANKTQYIWRDILKRKTELASQLDADWFIHADADEFRDSPWPGLTLKEAIHAVDRLGYNAIDFELLNFRPVDNSFVPGEDVRKFLQYYEGTEDYNALQVKAWKNLHLPIELVSSGGHDVAFDGRKIFPIKFILRHYPIRSQQHGILKVFHQRKNRFCAAERAIIWHVQYDNILDESHNFICRVEDLCMYDHVAVRRTLLGNGPYSRLDKFQNIALSNIHEGDDEYRAAVALVQAGKHSEAIEALKALVSMYPNHALAHNDLGVLYTNMGDYEKALACSRLACQKHPTNHQFKKNLADLLYIVFKNTEEALPIYLELMKELPNDIDVLTVLGRICTELSHLETAKTLYERIIELQPANEEAWQSLSALLNVQKDEKGDKQYVNICSIIIPVYNKVEYTKKCIDAIKKNTPQNMYEIIIVDNASTDETKSYLASINDPPIKIITNKENLGFAKACNQGAQAALTKYILFLNNDTEPQNGWIQPLIDILDNDRTVAAVGSKLLFPDGTIQHAGVMVTDDRQQGIRLAPWHPYNRHQANIPEANVPKTYQALTAACLLIRKESFDSVHGFDESYWNGYEDVDICFKLGKNNWRLVYQPASVVVHHESQSGPERFNKKDENLQLLQDRWIGIIEPDSVVYADGRAELTYAHKIQPYNTPNHNKDKTENSKAHDQMGEMGEMPEIPKIGLLSLDKHSFACPQIRLLSAIKFLDRQRLINYIDLTIEENQQLEIDKLKQLDVLIVQRNFAKAVPYEKLIALLGESRPKIVYEFDDAFGHMDKGHIAYAYYQSMRKEIEGYVRNADLVTVSTEILKSYYKKLNTNIVVIPNFIDAEIWRMVSKPKKRDDKIKLLFSGTIGHEPDLKVIEGALVKILNEYKDTIELLLWGNHNPRLEKLSNVKILSEFKSDYSEYAEILKNIDVDIALVPLEDTRFNQAKSHIKWLEYSSCAISGIYSNVGEYRTSIKNGNTGIVVNNSHTEWYRAIKKLITDESLRNLIAQATKDEVIVHHAVEQNVSQWLHAYKELSKAPDTDSKMANTIYEAARTIPRKKFSIIIITWNKATMLEQCLNALLKNLANRDECEIIIGDNGSTDATPILIKKFNIDKYVRKDTNEGLELYKELYDLAEGEYIIEIDNDVLDFPFGFEQRFAEYYSAFPDYGLFCLDAIQNEFTNGAKPDSSYYKDDIRGSHTIEEGLVGGWCLCIRRQIFEKIGKFGNRKLSMTDSQDGVLWRGVRSFGLRAGILKNIKCFHACGPYYSHKYGYLSLDIEKYKNAGLNSFVDAYKTFIKEEVKPKPLNIVVSVIIPLFNKIDYTKKCIAAIQKNVSKIICELILVDNNSTDVTAEYLETLGDQVRVITNNTNLGFAKACNQGAQAALGEFLLFLNNDTEPQQGWLEPLVDNLISDNSVAAVGSKLLYPDGTIQHAGIVIVEDRKNNDHLLAKNNHVGKPADAPEANIQTLYQALTAACVLIRKSAFKKAGGFDEKYWNGYEDVDLCFKLQEQRGKLAYQPTSVVIHHESQSGPERFAKAPENIKRLHKKWLGKIKPDIILNKDGSVKLTNAGKIRPYSAPGLAQKQLVPQPSTRQPNLVSIVILTFNELKYTRECAESIKKHTPEPHEIIFIDNASTDGTVKWLRKNCQENSNYKLVENKINLGFAKGCNQGIGASSGEYILLLNNDVVVTDNWLSGMLESLNSAQDTGIVGPMTNNISGTQKVHEADYNTIPGMTEYAKSFRKRYRHRRIALRRIVGFCMLLRRTLVDKIGLLDESFGTGNFEDDDYCLRATLAGYQNLIAGDVFIHHYGSRSFIGNRMDYGSSISGNIKIFDEKWMGTDVHTHLGKKFTALNCIEKADTLSQKGQIDKAIAVFIEGIKYAPEEKSVYYRLAEMLLDAKLYKDALEAVESMPQETRDELKRLEIIAYCTEKAEEAEKLADRILARDNNYAAAINLKGINAYKQGDSNAAADFFKKAITSDPGYGEPYTNLGVMTWASDQKDEALDWLEKGFILSPTLTDNITLYHTAITAMEQFERAERFFSDAKKLHPENKSILFFLIDIFIKQGKYNDAMQEIERAMLDIGIDEGMLEAALEIRRKVGIKEIDKAAKNKGTLSLCMIVKNEEQHLIRCLLSATPVVDEIIIVDTGSTDRTKDIARAFGAKVFDFPWTNDFSEARNVSLSKATGDWIIVLDADEVISALDYSAIEKIAKKKTAKPAAYNLNTRNYTNEVNAKGWIANDRKYLREEAGTGWFPSAKVRLFVNDKRIQFQNPVHEFVEGTLEKAGIEIKTSDIQVHHYGRFDRDKLTAKGKEYFLLGKKKIAEMKNDIKALKELAIQASELSEYDTSVELWKRVIKLNPNDTIAFLNISYAYMKQEKYEEALASSRRAFALDPAMKETALNYAGSEFIIGDIRKTISVLEAVLMKDSYYPPAMVLIGAAYYVDGQKEKALGLFEKLRKKRFDCSEFFNEQAKSLIVQGRFNQALAMFEAAAKTGDVNKDTPALLAECKSKMVMK